MALLLTTTVSVSCRQDKAGTTVADNQNQYRNDTQFWADSAAKLNKKVNDFFNAGLTDSLEAFVPGAMRTCLEHNQLESYYTIWRVLAEKYIWIDEYDKAMKMAMEMEADATKRHVKHGLFEAYCLLGLGYSYRWNQDESIKYFRKAIDIFDSENASSLMTAYEYLSMLLDDEQYNKELKATLDEWKVQIDKRFNSNTADDKRRKARWNFGYQRMLAEYLRNTRKYDAASAALDSAEHYMKMVESTPLNEVNLLTSRSVLAHTLHDYKSALKYSEQMEQLATEVADNSHTINAMTLKGQALEGLGRYQDALKVMHRMSDFKDSLTTASNFEQLNHLNKRFEVNELKMKTMRNQMKARERLMFLLTLLIVIVILALLVFIIYRHRTTARLEKAHVKLQQAYKQLETANAKANESLRMKSSFIQQISQEIRTPLDTLTGFTQTLTTPDAELDDQEQEKVTQGIVENTNRISELVNRVLALSEASSQTADGQRD